MAKDTLYFYDLETSGIQPRTARIMQFAGQRTTLDLEPIGEPDNILIKMTEDTLPDPRAILVTGITPQQTIADGISEREFCDYFTNTVASPHTTLAGFNSVRFDNEFIRFILYRNFHDPYEWSYSQGRSVWDLLDVVRMTRALRPEGIKWPFAPDGAPSNSLERLTSINRIEHSNAHDALADVRATIAIAKLIRQKQPKLFSYLYSLRTKQAVQKVILTTDPFVYTTGRYPSAHQKTSVAVYLSDHPTYGASRALVYDLRHDPKEFMSLSTTDLVERLLYTKDSNAPNRLPVKELVYNKCPAVAPIAVLTKEAQDSIGLTLDTVRKNFESLSSDKTFVNRVRQAFEDVVQQRQTEFIVSINAVDSQLYEGFLNEADKKLSRKVRDATNDTIADYAPEFIDDRLPLLLVLYKARQFQQVLSAEEQAIWEQYRYDKLYNDAVGIKLPEYFSLIQSLANTANSKDKSILEDLWLWGERIMPEASI